MNIAVVLALFGAGVAAYGFVTPGPMSNALILGGAIVGALALVVALGTRQGPRPAAAVAVRNGIVIDGSNVMHWGNGPPSLDIVRIVVETATQRGWAPGVIFDANAGYKLAGRYKDDAELAYILGLPEDRVLVVPKGTPADPVILNAARTMGGRIISNDRFRDWSEDFPEVAQPGFVIPGSVARGRLRLDLPRVQ